MYPDNCVTLETQMRHEFKSVHKDFTSELCELCNYVTQNVQV